MNAAEIGAWIGFGAGAVIVVWIGGVLGLDYPKRRKGRCSDEQNHSKTETTAMEAIPRSE